MQRWLEAQAKPQAKPARPQMMAPARSAPAAPQLGVQQLDSLAPAAPAQTPPLLGNRGFSTPVPASAQGGLTASRYSQEVQSPQELQEASSRGSSRGWGHPQGAQASSLRGPRSFVQAAVEEADTPKMFRRPEPGGMALPKVQSVQCVRGTYDPVLTQHGILITITIMLMLADAAGNGAKGHVRDQAAAWARASKEELQQASGMSAGSGA